MKIGKINFANTLPFFCGLEMTSDSKLKLIEGTPSAVNKMLKENTIDAGIASSFHYAQHSEELIILPEHCIAATGASKSVLLISEMPVEKLDGKTIGLTSKSLSAVHLLKILFLKFWKVKVDYEVFDKREDLSCSTYLLIGDEALLLSKKSPFIYDLSEVWESWTGLPFCFALWLVRKEYYSKNREEVEFFSNHLTKTVKKNLQSPSEMLICQPFEASQKRVINDYLCHLEYNLNSEVVEGLRLYYQHAYELGFLKEKVNPILGDSPFIFERTI